MFFHALHFFFVEIISESHTNQTKKMEAKKSLAELKEEAWEYMRVNVLEKYKSLKPEPSRLEYHLQEEIEEAFIREQLPELQEKWTKEHEQLKEMRERKVQLTKELAQLELDIKKQWQIIWKQPQEKKLAARKVWEGFFTGLSRKKLKPTSTD
jgi:hypothetical protein